MGQKKNTSFTLKVITTISTTIPKTNSLSNSVAAQQWT